MWYCVLQWGEALKWNYFKVIFKKKKEEKKNRCIILFSPFAVETQLGAAQHSM